VSLVVAGRGLIGGAVRDHLRARGVRVATVARSGGAGRDDWALDLATPPGRGELAARLDREPPDRLVLTHGPSDVTWMERNEATAAGIHCGVAEVAAASGVPILLISTDNVFSGERGRMRPADPIAPPNAYGRLKAEAERIVLAAGGAVLRVSLVYGDAAAGHRPTYAQQCLAAAAAGEQFLAPVDQSFTPIHVDDVTRVVSALATTVPRAGVVEHLAGPVELSRYEFARLAYAAAGADPGLVRPCARADTVWASRPRWSSLAGTDYADLLPDSWPPAGPDEGLRRMLLGRDGRDRAAVTG
jgi:dTDP-4-dehydrorhamnose reductase